jgi:hypothetical protein
MGGGGGGGHLRGIVEYMFCLVKGEFYRKEREEDGEPETEDRGRKFRISDCEFWNGYT